MAVSYGSVGRDEADAHERKVSRRLRQYFASIGLLLLAYLLAVLTRFDGILYAAMVVLFPVGLVLSVRLWFVMRRDIELRGGYRRFGAGFLALMPYAVIAWLVWRRSHPIHVAR